MTEFRTLNELIVKALGVQPEYGPVRAGDVRHLQADFSKARERLGYEPTHTVRPRLAEALEW